MFFSPLGLTAVSRQVYSIRGRTVHNPSWLAPEVMVQGIEYTEKADVYSYGIILWYNQGDQASLSLAGRAQMIHPTKTGSCTTEITHLEPFP